MFETSELSDELQSLKDDVARLLMLKTTSRSLKKSRPSPTAAATAAEQK
jgi:hypothetical protein